MKKVGSGRVPSHPGIEFLIQGEWVPSGFPGAGWPPYITRAHGGPRTQAGPRPNEPLEVTRLNVCGGVYQGGGGGGRLPGGVGGRVRGPGFDASHPHPIPNLPLPRCTQFFASFFDPNVANI